MKAGAVFWGVRGGDQWSSAQDFLRLGSPRAECITCLEALDHSTAYSHTSNSIWCCSHSSRANDPGPAGANGPVINTSKGRIDPTLWFSRWSREIQLQESSMKKDRYKAKDGSWLSVNNVKISASSHEMKWGVPQGMFLGPFSVLLLRPRSSGSYVVASKWHEARGTHNLMI